MADSTIRLSDLPIKAIDGGDDTYYLGVAFTTSVVTAAVENITVTVSDVTVTDGAIGTVTLVSDVTTLANLNAGTITLVNAVANLTQGTITQVTAVANLNKGTITQVTAVANLNQGTLTEVTAVGNVNAGTLTQVTAVANLNKGTVTQVTTVVNLNHGTVSLDTVNINNDGTLDVRIPNGPNIDAFGRFRTSNPTTIFDDQPEYGINTLIWNTSVTGSATASVVADLTASQIVLTIGSNKGDKAILQSKRYVRYQPTKSQLVALTGNLKEKKAGVRQRIGLFDDNNGMFFEMDENDIKTVVRTKTTGTVIDTTVAQGSWNVDALDGNGESGLTLDISKAQIFLIDYQALYVGRIRYGFDINGKNHTVNQVLNANNITLPFCQTPNLPIRYEIEATTTASSDTSMSKICAAVVSEGGTDNQAALPHAISTGNLLTTLGTVSYTPIISIRAKQTISGKQNRAEIFPEGYEVYAETRGIQYRVLLNATITTASWQSAGTNALIDYDTASTVVSGGEIIASGFVGAGVQQKDSIPSNILAKIPLTRSIDNTTFDTITIAALGIGGAASSGARLSVREIY